MKIVKRTVLLLVVFSLLFCSCLSVSAAENEFEYTYITMDSVYFSEEEKNLYRDSPEDQVIKIYTNAPFLYQSLQNRRPYETVLAMTAMPFVVGYPVYMVISPTGETMMKDIVWMDYYLGGRFSYHYICSTCSDWESVSQYILTPSLIFGEAKVYKTYCVETDMILKYNVSAEPYMGGGLWVCYVTNKGDFFLHKPTGDGDTLYILPEDAAKKHCVSEDEEFDLEPYRLENFSLEAKEPEGQEPLPNEPTEQETLTTDALNTQTPDAQPSTDENASTAWYVWALTALGGAVIGAGGAVMIGTVRRKKKE